MGMAAHILGLRMWTAGAWWRRGLFDAGCKAGRSLALSIDIQVQNVLREELGKAMLNFTPSAPRG